MPGLSDETKKQIKSLYERGFFTSEISKVTGIPYTNIYNYAVVGKDIFRSNRMYRHFLVREQRLRKHVVSGLIRYGLRRSGLNQSQVAREMGISRQTINSCLNEKVMPRKDTLRKLSSILKLDHRTLEGLL